MSTLEALMHRQQALNINQDPMAIEATVKITHLLLREAGAQLVVNYSGDRRSSRSRRSRRPRHPLLLQDPFRPQPTKSLCHWEIYFTWLIIPGTLDQTRRAACYFMVWLRKAKPVDVLVVGIAAPSLLPMIAGTPVVKHLVKLVSLFVKSVAYGVSCDDLSTNSV